MRKFLQIGFLIAWGYLASANGWARLADDQTIIKRVSHLLEEVRNASYPELKDADIQIKLFDSPSDYFQTRFTFTSFLFQPKLHYLLKVNRRLFNQPASDTALRAILAHEVGHIVYFKTKHRYQLLSLVRLATPNYSARFERRTDLVALLRGYGDGLKSYRVWLYQHIPVEKIAEKKRNYFSPEEIDALLQRMQLSERLIRWLKRPPRSLQEIER